MLSLRAKFFNSLVRLWIRRRRFRGSETEFAKDKRRRFGTPRFLQGLYTTGLDVKRVDDENFRGEWIRPKEVRPGTVILYIHGGGFIACSARTHRPITTALARKSGLPVFAVDYRRAPENRFPAAIDDVFVAYKNLRENNNVVVAGDSAGGGLVLSLMVRAREEGLQLPACAVCFSPWADLTPRGPDCLNADSDAMFFPENVAEYAAVYLGGNSALNPLASPARADLTGLPRLLLQVSSTEILLEDSLRVHERVLASGGRSRLEVFDSLAHCWQMWAPFVPESREALDQAAEFIKENT